LVLGFGSRGGRRRRERERERERVVGEEERVRDGFQVCCNSGCDFVAVAGNTHCQQQ